MFTLFFYDNFKRVFLECLILADSCNLGYDFPVFMNYLIFQRRNILVQLIFIISYFKLSHAYFLLHLTSYYNQYNQMKKPAANDKVPQNDKYYRISADFGYLSEYNYEITKEIGRGGYGVVYKAIDLGNQNSQCAIKINFNTVSRQLIFAEMAYLQLVKGKSNLPKLVNLFVHEEITHIVIEYFRFKPFITFFHTFGFEDIKYYLWELLSGLKNLKDLGIYHRDIKPGNFLYDPQTKKGIIIDFGLAQLDPQYLMKLEQRVKKLSPDDPNYQKQTQIFKIYKRLSDCLKIIGKNKIGTETYMPIESILHHHQQSYNSDMWPVGVILLQFVARKYNIFNNVRMVNKPATIKNTYFINYLIQLATFYGDKVIEECKNLGYELKLPKEIEQVRIKDIAMIQGYDDVVDDLLNRLLDIDATTRISVEEAMAHPFFQTVRAAKAGIPQ